MRERTSSRSGRRNQRGFIVVAVLWILAALSALVLIYLSYVTNTAVVVAGTTGRVQIEALVTAAVELTAFQLTSVGEKVRPTSGTFNARIGKGRVNVTLVSEAARVDLNAAPKSLLAGLMSALGAAPSEAEGYADRILAWRAPAENGDDDPENSLYRTSGAAYIPRHAPFPHTDELWLVRGIPPAVQERMLPFVTVFSNLASVDILDAAPEVVAALPGMTPLHLREVLAQRGDPTIDPKTLLGSTGAGEAASLEASKAYRISIAVASGTTTQQGTAEVVILLLESGDQPYRVLSWHNGADGDTEPQRTDLK
jgi:general secretion pathway protein K